MRAEGLGFVFALSAELSAVILHGVHSELVLSPNGVRTTPMCVCGLFVGTQSRVGVRRAPRPYETFSHATVVKALPRKIDCEVAASLGWMLSQPAASSGTPAFADTLLLEGKAHPVFARFGPELETRLRALDRLVRSIDSSESFVNAYAPFSLAIAFKSNSVTGCRCGRYGRVTVELFGSAVCGVFRSVPVILAVFLPCPSSLSVV